MKRLVVVVGPTAVGKTAYAVRIAREMGTEIVSCDSRQFYSELDIGVARPSTDELHTVRHHFIACRSVTTPYNIYDYTEDALQVIERLMADRDVVVAVGGSGLYIDALCSGVAHLPDPDPELRSELQQMPLEEKQSRLRLLDPEYYARVDLRNPVRLQRALEVCLMTGRPYSQVLAAQQAKQRPFEVEMRQLVLEPSALRERIDRRVDLMMTHGLVDEVRSVEHYRHLNTLRTVGYRELFPVLDGLDTVEHAVAQIKLNTWHYAKKQMTWFKKKCIGQTVDASRC